MIAGATFGRRDRVADPSGATLRAQAEQLVATNDGRPWNNARSGKL
jgi:hypothetical protein